MERCALRAIPLVSSGSVSRSFSIAYKVRPQEAPINPVSLWSGQDTTYPQTLYSLTRSANCCLDEVGILCKPFSRKGREYEHFDDRGDDDGIVSGCSDIVIPIRLAWTSIVAMVPPVAFRQSKLLATLEGVVNTFINCLEHALFAILVVIFSRFSCKCCMQAGPIVCICKCRILWEIPWNTSENYSTRMSIIIKLEACVSLKAHVQLRIVVGDNMRYDDRWLEYQCINSMHDSSFRSMITVAVTFWWHRILLANGKWRIVVA